MFVLHKILRLLFNTLTDDDRYSLLYIDNSMQPIQILLSYKQNTFSEFWSAFLRSTLNFEHSRKKDHPHSRCISQITVSEKGDSINVCKILFKRYFHKKHSKRVQRLLKYAKRYLCHICSSLQT